MNRIFIGLVLMFYCCRALPQYKVTLEPLHSDCSEALEITDSIWGPVSPPVGPGRIQEFSAPKASPWFFEKEHHTVWYVLNIQKSCTLSFDIIPESINDDYDFLLFQDDGKDDFCLRIAGGQIKPLRSVISRNDKHINSRTGLNRESTHRNIRPGPGPSYAAALAVKKGEKYYLVLDNVYPNGKGHSIRFYYTGCMKNEEPLKIPDSGILPETYIALTITDRNTGEMINSQLILKSFGEQGEELVFTDVSALNKALRPTASYNIRVTSHGYFSHNAEFLSPKSGESLTMHIKLDKIEVGNKIILDNIYFHGGTAQFTAESFPALRNLGIILRENPTVKVEIQGHVNKPLYVPENEGDSPERLQKLSDERAFAVYEYLIRRGVEANRLKWKGYSNSMMIHPYGRAEEQQQKNRRVEILILEK